MMSAKSGERTWAGLVAVAALLLGGAAVLRPAARVAPSEPAQLVPFVTLSGADSHITDERCLRITTPGEWAALWLEHLGLPPRPNYNLYANEAGLPLVDFDQCMVIAVFGGASHNSDGYGFDRSPVTPSASADAAATEEAGADHVALRINSHSFQTAGPGGAVAVTPYGFFIVPRSVQPLLVQYVERGPGDGGRGRLREHASFPALPATLPALPPEPLGH